MQPLYQLEIGEASESCALYIVRRLGLSQKIIDRASIAAYRYRLATKSKLSVNHISCIDLQVQERTPSQIVYNQSAKKRIQQHESKKAPDTPRSMRFNIGDSVMVYP